MNCRMFLAAQGVDLTFVRETSDVHSGTAIITVANADNTIVVIPGANALVSAADVAGAAFAAGDIAVSQFEIPLPAITAFFQQRPRGRRDHDPQSGAGDRIRAPRCSISSIF